MEYHVKFYGNTGFSLVNIPYCIQQNRTYWDNLLSPFLMFERDIYINANQIHPYIDVAIDLSELTEYNILNCDYIDLELDNDVGYYQHLFYVVNNIVAIQEDVYRLYLSIDAINSIGGIGLDTDEFASKILQGTIQRMHVRDDTIGKYTLDEPFQPKEELQLEIKNIDAFKTNNFADIVELSAIVNDEHKAISYNVDSTNKNNEEGELVNIILPELVAFPSQRTTIQDNDMHTFRVPSTVYFKYSEVANVITALRQIGAENAIVNSWRIPLEYFRINEMSIPIIGLSLKYINNISGTHGVLSSSNAINLLLNCTNKKCCVGRFNVVSLVSLASGERIDLQGEDVVADDGKVYINWYADPRPNGSPCLYFNKFKGTFTYPTLINSVSGCSWQKNPIVFTSASGESVARKSFYYDKQIKEYNYSIQNFNNLLKGANKTLKDLVNNNDEYALIDTTTTALQLVQNRAMQLGILDTETKQFELNIKYVQPQIIANYNESIRDMIGNAFVITRTKLSDNDLQAYDKFLTNYGYNVGSVPYTDTNCLTDRTAYNYIQFSDIHIKSFAPQYLVELAEQQFKNGIRLWHKMPSYNDYATNANPLIIGDTK